jgi:TfoX/Sxy family transcriptional regulator of competence genes
MNENPGSSWKKAPAEMVAFFKDLMTGQPEIDLRTMFGYPCAFINGQMFTGLFGDRMFLRLPEEERARFQAQEGAGPFEPIPGRTMKEYVLVPPALLSDRGELDRWLAVSATYAANLPAKVKKPKNNK